jgi:hypothetical protein
LVTIGHTPLYNRGGTTGENHNVLKNGRLNIFGKEEILLDAPSKSIAAARPLKSIASSESRSRRGPREQR